MSIGQGYVQELQNALKFFNASTSVFDENDLSYAPQPELYTVAGHVAHTADTVDWFIEGAFGSGWNMDFEAEVAKAKAVSSLAKAKEHLEAQLKNINVRLEKLKA